MPLGRLLAAAALLGGCVEASPGVGEEPPPPEPPPPEALAPDDDAERPGGEESEVDCSVLPDVPVDFHEIHGFGGPEDFDLDGEGFLGAVTNTDLVGRSRAGEQRLYAPNVAHGPLGTRVLPSGDWVVVEGGLGSVVHVEVATGARTTLLGGLGAPNGLEVDRSGRVYVTEMSAGRIQSVDPETLQSQVIATGLSGPNGIILSPDEQTLYVASWGGGIYAVSRTGPESWGPPRVLWAPPPESGILGAFDGVHVDACENVYVTDAGDASVWRITPDGQRYDLVARLPSAWIPNLRWGHGIGGWEPDVLYVVERMGGRVFGLEMGIVGKKHVLRP